MKKTQEASNDSVEIQSHWAKYLCVISAGVIENAIKEIYIEYVQRMVSKPVANYVISNLGQLRNPKTQKFLETAAAFKTIWKEDLESFVLVNGRGDAIDSIMGNRHLIAHGKDANSRITIAQLKDYLLKAIEVLEFIEDQCTK